MGFDIRAATTSDRDGIVEVFLACWQESYAGVLPAGLVNLMDRQKAEALWTRVLAETALGVTWVAVQSQSGADAADDGVLGMTRFEVAPRRCGKVHSLYVSPQAQGTGLGVRLLGAVTDALTLAGCEVAQLWVFADNAPALGFYESQGWRPDGTERIQPEFGQREIRLTRTLMAAGTTGGAK